MNGKNEFVDPGVKLKRANLFIFSSLKRTLFAIAIFCSLFFLFQNCGNSELVLPEPEKEEIKEIVTIDKAELVNFGGSLSLELGADVSDDTIIEWSIDNNIVAGETGTTLSIDNMNYNSQGTYRAKDSDGNLLLESVVTVKEALSCKQILEFTPGTPSGAYDIDPDGDIANFGVINVNCDMTTNGGGWTEVNIAQARNAFKGVMIAVQAAPSAGFDAQDRPFTQDAGAVGAADAHTYHYTFDIPFGYEEFFTSNYQLSSNAGPGDFSDLFPGFFIQSTWNIANSGTAAEFGGDVSFGSPSNAGPTVTFAQGVGGNTQVAPGQPLVFPSDGTIFRVSSAPVSQFRIGWGESGGEVEGWFPWFAGTILFR